MPVPQCKAVSELAEPDALDRTLKLNFALFLAQVIDIVCTTGVGLSTQ